MTENERVYYICELPPSDEKAWGRLLDYFFAKSDTVEFAIGLNAPSDVDAGESMNEIDRMARESTRQVANELTRQFLEITGNADLDLDDIGSEDLILGTDGSITVVTVTDKRSSLDPIKHCLKETFVSKWRSQMPQDRLTEFLRYDLTPEVISFVRDSAPFLRDWTLFLPEDPALYSGEEAVMWTTSSTNVAFLLLTTDEARELEHQGFSLQSKGNSEPPTRKEDI